MFKALIAFCLSRRPIVVLGVVLFTLAGFIAFKMLNIEAYPNPTPVILEITAQAPGPLGRGDGTLLHDSHGNRALHHARH